MPYGWFYYLLPWCTKYVEKLYFVDPQKHEDTDGQKKRIHEAPVAPIKNLLTFLCVVCKERYRDSDYTRLRRKSKSDSLQAKTMQSFTFKNHSLLVSFVHVCSFWCIEFVWETTWSWGGLVHQKPLLYPRACYVRIDYLLKWSRIRDMLVSKLLPVTVTLMRCPIAEAPVSWHTALHW